MKKIIFPFVFIFVLIACENSEETEVCPVNEDFNIVQTNFKPYKLISKDGNLYAFFEEKTNNTTIFQIKKSIDLGRSWEKLFEIDENKTSNLFLFQRSINDFQEADNGIYWLVDDLNNVFKSTDYGISWENMVDYIENQIEGSNPLYARQFVKDSDGNIFLAGKNQYLYRSLNNGEDWEELKYIFYTSLDILDDIIFLYSNAESRLFVSTDNGDTWIENTDFYARIHQFFVDRDWFVSSDIYSFTKGENSVYYVMAALNSNHLFGKSNDGVTWQFEEVELNNDDYYLENLIGVNNNGELYASGRFENLIYSYCQNDTGIFKSTDGGQSWENVLKMSVSNWLTIHDNYVIFIDYDRNLNVSKERLY